jgi:hypothetical protein
MAGAFGKQGRAGKLPANYFFPSGPAAGNLKSISAIEMDGGRLQAA